MTSNLTQSSLDFLGVNMEEIEDTNINSPMKDYFRGKTILLTGGTGFLGTLYIEKLLRCEVESIYVLARKKKDKTPVERIKEFETNVVFAKVMAMYPDCMQRLRIIEGDLGQLGLGISETDLQDIYENVEIVLHAAADVRFDETLRKLLIVNLRGTKELLKIAERIRKLQVFSYISTAFSHCVRDTIDEKFYPPPQDPELMIKYAEKIHEDPSQEPEIIQERIIMPWPNTYTYSKSLSEELVRRWGTKFPICIIRPSVVISTHEDPLAGWSNNIYGLNGVLVAAGLGFMRVLPYDHKGKGDFVCADFVINSTLCAIWHTHDKSVSSTVKDVSDPEIFNICASEERAVHWSECARTLMDYFNLYPVKQAPWVPTMTRTTCPFMLRIYIIHFHFLPALIFDAFFRLTKQDHRFLPMYRKVHIFLMKLKFFMTSKLHFDNTNAKRMWDMMSDYDKEFFPADVRRYKWSEYLYTYCLGLKKYFAHETNADVPEAKRIIRKKKAIHYGFVLPLFYGTYSFLLYKLLEYFGTIAWLKDSWESCISSTLFQQY